MKNFPCIKIQVSNLNLIQNSKAKVICGDVVFGVCVFF